MAHGLPSDFSSVLFNAQIAMSFQERLAKNLAIFNAAGGNTIRLVNGDIIGNGTESSFRSRTTGGTVVGRDVTSVAAKTYNKSLFNKMVSAVSPWKVNDIADSKDALDRIQQDQAKYASELGQELADDLTDYYLQITFGCVAGALQAVTSLVTLPTTDITFDVIADMLQAIGDQKKKIKTLFMDSRTANVYLKARVAANIYQEAGITVYGGDPGTLGRPVIVVDDDVFAKNTLQAGKGFIFGLAENAVVAKTMTSVPMSTELDRTVENIPLATTGEGDIEVMVDGMAYGGAINNTTLSVFQAAASWSKAYAQDKALPFVGSLLTLP
jgi:hypothetical protein